MLGVIPQPFTEEDLGADILFNEPFVVVVARKSRWARQRGTDLAELIDLPWVIDADL